MSQENVEILRGAFDALARGDATSFLSVSDPEIEWDMSRLMPDGRIYHGRDGLREFLRAWAGTWDDFSAELVEAVDAGDQVVVDIRNVGTGRGSGAAVEMRFGQVWTFRDRKVVRHRAFPSFDEALEAAGLRE